MGYTYYFTKTWGLTTGFDVNLYRTDFALHPNTTLSSYEVDDQGSGFEYRVSPVDIQKNSNSTDYLFH